MNKTRRILTFCLVATPIGAYRDVSAARRETPRLNILIIFTDDKC